MEISISGWYGHGGFLRNMDVLTPAIEVIFILLGLFLLLFNKRLGLFLERNGELYNVKLERLLPWYPRLNVILVGLFFVIAGGYQLAVQLIKWR